MNSAILTQGGSGTAVPSGMVWEQLSVLGSEATTTTTGGVTVTVASLPITSAGTWKIEFWIWNSRALNTNANAYFIAQAKYNDSSFVPTATTTGDSSGAVTHVTPDGLVNNAQYGVIPGFVNATDGAKTVYLRQYINISSGTPSYRGKIIATRIA